MSLLHNVLFSHRCTSTHHKIVLDALWHLREEQSDHWRRLFLKYSEAFLAGAQAPDEVFRDYRNHVLHVREKFWGGAVDAAQTWYKNTIESLTAKKWAKAAYAAGALSHYYADPLMPLHTACTEEAGIVHRACEAAIFRSYDHLMAILERDLGGYPDVKLPAGPRWLSEMVKSGARLSHQHYDIMIDHYSLPKGQRNPAAGLDDEMRVSLAECLGQAVVGFARILDRAIGESGVAAPNFRVGLAGIGAWCRIPSMDWARRRSNARDRRAVKSNFKEFRKTGKVINTLSPDAKNVRQLHAEEVLKTTPETLDAIKPRTVGAKHGTGTYLRPMATQQSPGSKSDSLSESPQSIAAQSTPEFLVVGNSRPVGHDDQRAMPTERVGKPVPRLAKFHLDLSSALADSPSIGNRNAEKLAAVGIRTVSELLAKKPEEVVERLKLGHIKPDTVRDWQTQAQLVCRVPNLRALDVKILVACGICEPEELAKCEALDLLDRVDLFVSTSEGQRAIRGGSQPDLDIVRCWIESARHARTLKAA